MGTVEKEEEQRKHNRVALATAPVYPAAINLALIDDESRESTLAFYESGEFLRSTRLVCKVATRYLRAIEVDRARDVVVFDVDDTALSSWHHMRETQFARLPLAAPDWFLAASAPALGPVLGLYETVRDLGFRIVFVSERPAEAFESTKEALVRAGFHSFQHLVLRGARDEERGRLRLRHGEFKFEAREALVQRGFRIVASVGDQDSDFVGGHAGFAVKIPNLLYQVD